MVETADGGGYFKEVTVYPKVVVSDESMIEKANALHHDANKMCFVANSVNFPVLHNPSCNTI
jgi:organic hydroperoxide reductase OsmC/OhrA